MKAKKKVFVVAVAVCLIAILSMSSLAWFSDQDEVTNEFMLSTSDADDDPGKISVGDSTEGGKYEHIYPSQTLVKEPHVENTGKYDQWIRVKVTVTDAADWMQICNALAANTGKEYDLSNIFQGHDEAVWTVGEKTLNNDDSITYTYYLNSKLEPTKDVVLFDEIIIPYQLTQYELATLDGGFEIKMVAEAIQADNTGDTVFEAFELVEQTQPF